MHTCGLLVRSRSSRCGPCIVDLVLVVGSTQDVEKVQIVLIGAAAVEFITWRAAISRALDVAGAATGERVGAVVDGVCVSVCPDLRKSRREGMQD